MWGQLYTKARNRLSVERAEKLIFIKNNYQPPDGAQHIVGGSAEDWEVCLTLLEAEAPVAAAAAADTVVIDNDN